MNECKEFDERQVQVRGGVYKIGFIFLSVFTFVDAMLKNSGIIWADYMTTAWIGIMATISLCSILLILKYAYTPAISNRPNILIIILSLASVSSIIFGISDMRQQGFVLNGQISAAARTLILGLLFLSVTVVYWVKKLLGKKDDRDE